LQIILHGYAFAKRDQLPGVEWSTIRKSRSYSSLQIYWKLISAKPAWAFPHLLPALAVLAFVASSAKCNQVSLEPGRSLLEREAPVSFSVFCLARRRSPWNSFGSTVPARRPAGWAHGIRVLERKRRTRSIRITPWATSLLGPDTADAALSCKDKPQTVISGFSWKDAFYARTDNSPSKSAVFKFVDSRTPEQVEADAWRPPRNEKGEIIKDTLSFPLHAEFEEPPSAVRRH